MTDMQEIPRDEIKSGDAGDESALGESFFSVAGEEGRTTRLPMAGIVDCLIGTGSGDIKKAMRRLKGDLDCTVAALQADETAILRAVVTNPPAGTTIAHLVAFMDIYNDIVTNRRDLVTAVDHDCLLGLLRTADSKVAAKAARSLQSLCEDIPGLVDSPETGEEVRECLETSKSSSLRLALTRLLAAIMRTAPEFSNPAMCRTLCAVIMDVSQQAHVREAACDELPTVLAIYPDQATPELMRIIMVNHPTLQGTARVMEMFPDKISEDDIVDILGRYDNGLLLGRWSRLATHCLRLRPDLVSDAVMEKFEAACSKTDGFTYAYYGIPSLRSMAENVPGLAGMAVQLALARAADGADLPCNAALKVCCASVQGARELFRQAEGKWSEEQAERFVLGSYLEAEFSRIAGKHCENILSIYPSLLRDNSLQQMNPVTVDSVEGFFSEAGHAISRQSILEHLDTSLFAVQEEQIVLPIDIAGSAYRGGYEVETSSCYLTFSAGVALKNVPTGGEIVRECQKSGRKGLWEYSVCACAEASLPAVKDPRGILSFLFTTVPDASVQKRFIPYEDIPFLPLVRILISLQRGEMKAASRFFRAMSALSNEGIPVQEGIACLDEIEAAYRFLVSEGNGWLPQARERMFPNFDSILSVVRQKLTDGDKTAAVNELAGGARGFIHECAYRCAMAKMMNIPGYEDISVCLPAESMDLEPLEIGEPSPELRRWLTERR